MEETITCPCDGFERPADKSKECRHCGRRWYPLLFNMYLSKPELRTWIAAFLIVFLALVITSGTLIYLYFVLGKQFI